jgi:hypothetical protein
MTVLDGLNELKQKLQETEDEVKSAEKAVELHILSNPPSGKCKITNIYIDPVTGKTVVEYDTVPVP